MLVVRIFLCWFLLTSLAQAATTYIVDKTGAGNFTTIQGCVNQLISNNTPGDTCLVKNGNYAENVSIQTTLTGTSANPISLKNYPGHSPVIDLSSGTILGNGVAFNIADIASNVISYFVFEGFEIAGGNVSGYSGLKFGNINNAIFRNNYIHNFADQGVSGRTANTVTIDRNRVSQNGSTGDTLSHGMYLTGQNYVITNNIIEGSGNYGIQCAGYGSATRPAPVNATYLGFKNSLIANNTLAYSINRGGIVFTINSGSDVTTGGGISGVTVENNILYENSQNNTGGASGIWWSAGTDHITVKNNIFYATTPGATNFLPTDFVLPCNPCTYAGSSGNCVTCTVASNGTSTNPNMVNATASRPTSPDFHLTSGSVAIDFGLNLSTSFTNDFDNNTRPSGAGFDAGAYEFGSDNTPPAAPTGVVVQ